METSSRCKKTSKQLTKVVIFYYLHTHSA